MVDNDVFNFIVTSGFILKSEYESGLAKKFDGAQS